MSARITQEEAERRFKERGLILFDRYTKSNIKVKAICHCGKEYYAMPNSVFMGASSCGCKKGNLTTQEEMEKKFEEKGFKLIDKFVRSDKKVKAICCCGKEWMATPSMVTNYGHGCGCKSKITIEEVEKRLNKKKLTLIGEYKNNNSDILVRCHCGNEFSTTLKRVSKYTADICGCPNNKNRILTQEEAEKKFEEKGLVILGKYTRAETKVLARCHCGNEWHAIPYLIITGKTYGCGCRNRVTKEEAASKLIKKGFALIGDYINTVTKTVIRCHCGNDFLVEPVHLITNKILSCGCAGRSNGESLVVRCLEKYKCEYLREWTREGIRRPGTLRYDFYLPSHHAIIEFNGRQHFDKDNGFHDLAAKSMSTSKEQAFIRLQAYDKEKRDWAAANGIPLLDINYDEIDQVEDKVWNFLMELRARKNKKVA